MAAIRSDGETSANLHHAFGSLSLHSSNTTLLLDEIGHFRLHPDLKTGITLSLLNDEVQKIPLRHQSEKLATSWQVSEVSHLDHLLAHLTSKLTRLLMRTLEELFQQSQFVHQFES